MIIAFLLFAVGSGNLAAVHGAAGGQSVLTLARVAFNFTVTARDQFNNTATGYTGTPGSSRVILERLAVNRNTFGVRVDGTGTSGGTGQGVFLRNSVVSGNGQSGISIVAPAGSGGGNIFVERTAVVANGSAGIAADGTAGAVLVANSTITLNITGVATANGGFVFSFKTNNLFNNGTDGTFSASTLGQQ
jgi:hypothetical protein